MSHRLKLVGRHNNSQERHAKGFELLHSPSSMGPGTDSFPPTSSPGLGSGVGLYSMLGDI